MNVNDGRTENLESFVEEKAQKKKEENAIETVENRKEKSIMDAEVLDSEEKTDEGKQLPTADVRPQSARDLPATLHERFLRVRQIVKDAIAVHHTFMIYGKSRVIRECMLKRGWVEKFYRKLNAADQNLNVDSSPVLLLAGIGDLKDQQSERMLMSKMLTNHTVDFLWNTGSEWPGRPAENNKTTLFNRYYRAGFTSKVGLCSNVRQMHWYYEAGVANTLFPRCYSICQTDQMHAFVEDFRLTACMGLLKWLVDKIDTEGENAARSPTGTIPLKALDFALKRCNDYVSAQSHEDIDQEAEKVWSHQWDQFITWYYKVVQGEALFVRNNVPVHKYFLASRYMLKRIRKYWPQIDMDGVMNVWILKPGNKSRGRGIVLMNKLEDVLSKVTSTSKSQETRYVVQKYIERPMLIYSTKFDIRQWFIVTCAQPLTLWMYRESYLRFCSQKFSLSDFHESIHLCNNAVQCKYSNCGDRDPALPADNMWDATTFKEYLSSKGHPDAWDSLIYPGMKQGLVGSLLASQEAMDRRKNSFELYGADFMVMDDFSVWLIEINSHPDMSYSTSVTTRLCRQVMEDTIKVVIDYREDKNADTGEFELAYKQRMPTCQPYLGAALSLQGTRITTSEKRSSSSIHDSKLNLTAKSPMVKSRERCPFEKLQRMSSVEQICLAKKKSPTQNHIGPVIIDLIEELEIHLDQEFYDYFKSESPKFRQPLPFSEPLTAAKSADRSEKLEMLSKSTSTTIAVSTEKSKTIVPSETPTKPARKDQTLAKNPTHKPSRKSRACANTKREASPTHQSLVSKIVALQQQSSNTLEKSEKMSKRNEEKVLNTAIREAAKKYKKNAANASQVLTLLKPGSKATSSPKHARSRAYPKKHNSQKNKKVVTNMTDMYALGLGITK